MKKILLALLAMLTNCLASSDSYPMPKPFPPFHIVGNLYYVGTDDLANYLITTPQGNILINSDLTANVPMIKANIEKLGFKFSDTKILLINHAHLDHAQGSQLIRQQTHAQYQVMDADVPVIESGGKTDFHYSQNPSMYFPPTSVDKVLHDGDQVKLGSAVLTAHLTPGHTKGCTTWTMTIQDQGKPYHVVIVGSIHVNPGYQLVNNKNYPQIAQDFEHSLKVLKSMPCDIFLGAHASIFNLQQKYSQLGKQAQNPFIDPQGYKNYLAGEEKNFRTELEKQKTY